MRLPRIWAPLVVCAAAAAFPGGSGAAVLTPASFQPRQSRSLGSSALWTATGDFNGDGRTDVAVGSNGTNRITTFYQQPDRTLPVTGSTTTTGSMPTRLSAGDFNGDGRADLVYLEDDTGMKLRYGQANNTFSASTTLGPPFGPASWGKTAVGD